MLSNFLDLVLKSIEQAWTWFMNSTYKLCLLITYFTMFGCILLTPVFLIKGYYINMVLCAITMLLCARANKEIQGGK